MVTTLEAVLGRTDTFDYIIIETTGLANPGSLVDIFWLDEELESSLYLDGMVTMVDLLHLEQHLDDSRKQAKKDEEINYVNEAEKQIAYADRVILNKTDLVSEEDVARITLRVRSVNPMCTVVKSTFAVIDLDMVLNVRGYETNTLRLEALVKNEISMPHDSSVHSVVVRVDAPVVVKKLEAWLGVLLWETADSEIFRIKGCVNAFDSEDVYIIQAVQSNFEIQPSSSTWNDPKVVEDLGGIRITKMVFIGRNLNLPSLQAGVESAIAK